MPYTPTDEQRRAGSVPARLSRGDALFAPLWWIGRIDATPGSTRAAPEQSPGAALLAARGASWMGERGRWTAIAATDTTRRATISADGAWYLVIDIPPDAGGLGIVVNGQQVPTGWIPRTVATARPAAAGNAGNGWLGAALDSARRDPLDRWRARLAAGEPLSAVGPASDEFADRAVEALADQIGARWAQALYNVSEADAVVAGRLRQRLALIVDFGGAQAPAWPTDAAALDQLLAALLEPPRVGGARTAATIAQDWIDSQPRAACWIANDAVMFDASAGRIVSRIAVVTLDGTTEPDLLMVRSTASPTPLDVVTLRPLSAGTGLFSLEPDAQSPAVVLAGIGRWVARRAVQPRPIDAAPPGAPIGPLLAEWTLASWLSACTDAGVVRGAAALAGLGRPPAAPARGTMGMLLADAPAPTGAPGAADLRWVLYIECGLSGATPRDAAAREELVVAVSGAGGEAMLRAFADGQIVQTSGASTRARVVRDEQAWRIWIPLPPEVVGRGTWLRLGVLRTEVGGGRSSWPRPVFPWEDRPSQAVFDLRAWSGVER
ncbi:MAG: hypothetical protein KF869_05505 [Phycisphaeraceae bacterium]|nr:hypothetical protein [Phycisphaeraceae bacterium]